MFERYLDRNVNVEAVAAPEVGSTIGALEQALRDPEDRRPIPLYVNALRELRKGSQAISGHGDEIRFSHTAHARLGAVATELGLSSSHYNFDTSGSPLIVRESTGEHVISPTHFENGAYFSHPHADHQLEHSIADLPRIQVGKYVRLGRNAAINAGGDVFVGDAVWLSPGSQLLRQDHDPYGRPSVGSRTVAMTRLPAVRLCDYAWVGREAIVGWNADYLGKSSIVGLRSVVNSWVGDYSIVGDQGKVLQYLPYKAWLMERFQPAVEQTLQISDWAAVNSDWLTTYRDNPLQSAHTATEVKALFANLSSSLSVLLVGPQAAQLAPCFGEHSTDIISHSREHFAALLQWAQDNGQRRLRVRGDLSATALPFISGGHYHYRRKLGYGVVIIGSSESTEPATVLAEGLRVCAPGGLVLYPLPDLEASQDLPGELHRFPDIRLGEQDFAVLQKA